MVFVIKDFKERFIQLWHCWKKYIPFLSNYFEWENIFLDICPNFGYMLVKSQYHYFMTFSTDIITSYRYSRLFFIFQILQKASNVYSTFFAVSLKTNTLNHNIIL